jgi:hypothetical protein
MQGDDQLDDLGRELRERVGEEMRLEAEMLEHDAALVEQRRRRIADLALELVSRGDTVTAIAGDKSLRGRLVYARGDLATLETGAGSFDLHLAAGVILRIDERRAEGGVTPRSGSDSLRARLLAYEIEDRAVEVWIPPHHVEFGGRIGAVGQDHLIIVDRDGTEWVAQLADVAWVRPL